MLVDQDTDILYSSGMFKRDPSLIQAMERAGGAIALAEAAGVGVSAVYQWRRIPAKRVPAVSEKTGIPAAELRPDLAAMFGSGTSDDCVTRHANAVRP